MVSKNAMAIAAVLVIGGAVSAAVLGVPAAVFDPSDGADDPADPTTETAEPAGTPTATPASTATDVSTGTATPTPTSAPTPTPTPTPTTTPGPPPTATPIPTAMPIPTPTAASLNETRIERRVLARINDNLDDPTNSEPVMDTLATNSTTAGTLARMAGNYSAAMAHAGVVNHTADNRTAEERYAAYGLGRQCRLINDQGTYTLAGADLELLSRVDARGLTEDEVASAVVGGWLDDRSARRTLYLDSARHIGVGVTVRDGSAYVVADVC